MISVLIALITILTYAPLAVLLLSPTIRNLAVRKPAYRLLVLVVFLACSMMNGHFISTALGS